MASECIPRFEKKINLLFPEHIYFGNIMLKLFKYVTSIICQSDSGGEWYCSQILAKVYSG